MFEPREEVSEARFCSLHTPVRPPLFLSSFPSKAKGKSPES